MARGFKTGGRQKGSRNRRTIALENGVETVAAVITESLGISAFDGDAHAFLMAVYKNTNLETGIRVDAAKAAIRFEKPALTSAEVKSETTIRYVARVPDKSVDAETWQQLHAPTTH